MKITAIGDNRDSVKYLGRGEDGRFYATLDGGASWQLVSVAGEDGAQGMRGFNGVTFTPALDAAGWLTWTNDGGLANPEPVKLQTTADNGMKIFANIGDAATGYSRAAEYARANGVAGEVLSAQHSDGTWGLYQIQNNRTLELAGWYHTSLTFTSAELDADGFLALAIGAFPIAVKGGGEVIPVCPSAEDTANNIYRLNLSGLIEAGITYTIITVKE